MAQEVRSRSTAAHLAHKQTVQISFVGMLNFLTESLGTGLVVMIAGVSPRTVQRWAAGSGRADDGERRIRAAFQAYQEILAVEAPATVRAWFIGMNPHLDDLSPSEALGQDQLREVLSAARAFVSGG